MKLNMMKLLHRIN